MTAQFNAWTPAPADEPSSEHRGGKGYKWILIGVLVAIALALAFAFFKAGSARTLQSDPYTVDYQAAGLTPFDPADLTTYDPIGYFMWNGTMDGYEPPADGTNLVQYFKHDGADTLKYIRNAEDVCSDIRSGSQSTNEYIQYLLRDKSNQDVYQFGTSSMTSGQVVVSAIPLLFCPDMEYKFVALGLPEADFAKWPYTTR